MGIHGLLAQIGPGQRISVAKLAAQHYTTHHRPLRLAIDISIWLFQIQSGKGGSNPALRTFYYRLLRLLCCNIWPLFVFDGPNKPLFKRNKKVGGPGVRVASVPEFLAKQLLKQFGFPWHVAPGEAEAECAVLQREGVVDAVLSEDVDTLMFGSGMTVRNWTAENTTKSPTHANVYYADHTKEHSGMDREGMVLVALMSGGDYLPEGIPGCGPKVACDAARAGFGRDLCALSSKDTAGIAAWKDRLQHQIRTNEAEFFSRRNTKFTIPDDFPSLEVLGYYTHPCVSTPDKLARLRRELQWDQSIDFPALRSFTADAFDWRCLGGAKKFIKNLAPAMLLRELRMRGDSRETLDQQAQEELEGNFITAIHGTRNHAITDGELEYRVSFVPSNLVGIDLSLEEEDDQFIPAGGAADESEAESEFNALPSSTQELDDATEIPASPSKKRTPKPFDPTQPEKLWVLKTFLQVGCPLLLEDYEASFKDPKAFLKARRKARAAAKGDGNSHATKTKKTNKQTKSADMPENALMKYAKVTKPGSVSRADGGAMKSLTSSETNSRHGPQQDAHTEGLVGSHIEHGPRFRLPATQLLPEVKDYLHGIPVVPRDVLDLTADTPPAKRYSDDSETYAQMVERPFAAFAYPKKHCEEPRTSKAQRTPKKSKKRPSPDLSSPVTGQKTITNYYVPSPRKEVSQDDIINLVSSSPSRDTPKPRPITPSPPNTRFVFRREDKTPQLDFATNGLPDTVTKRRRKEPLKRWQTEPVLSTIEPAIHDGMSSRVSETAGNLPTVTGLECSTPYAGGIAVDLVRSSSPQDDEELPDLTLLLQSRWCDGLDDRDASANARKIAADAISQRRARISSDPADVETVRPTLGLGAANVLQETPLPLYRVKPHAATKTAHPSTALPLRQSPRAQASEQNSDPPLRRSPRQHQATRKRVGVQKSSEGRWNAVEVEAVDLCGDVGGMKKMEDRARIEVAPGKGWTQSEIEVCDLTGT